ncbi:hypothetical protein [Pseudarthrobacter sulfonivorans]|uniref:hypothetical protein n=1 Tax=Pseudarthrobacter sulfonivorans TaxID=121292 RepID=UPI00277DB654|nr:hypothetical protein [Pseudarthrobacter sulfonivorans]MDP9999750.1 hypothetical protein [Pseudarthrobacter sulfonivorans]
MSGLIIRRWKLAVLRVSLDLSARPAVVRSRLDSYAGDREVTYWERSDALADFGLALSGETPRTVQVPQELERAVERSMLTELPAESALWLRLEPPYGYLGSAPWEALAERIHVPVLRVPDRLPVAASLGDTWHVTMVVSAPSRTGWGATHVSNFARALARSATMGEIEKFEIDVFPNLTVYQQLTGAADDLPYVRIHDPGDFVRQPRTRPAPNRVGGTRRIDSDDDPRLLWAEWITDRLGSRASSALHVAAQGLASDDRSMLTISVDPASPQTPRRAATADAYDVWSLADAIGASLVSIAAPEHERRDIGARMVADRLGQLRPGPTIFSSIELDPDCQALARIHSFLAMQRDNELPGDPSWFGYIQPESIQQALAQPLPARHTNQAAPPLPSGPLPEGLSHPESYAPTAPLSESVSGSEVPRWVASSSRFIETRQANLSNAIDAGERRDGPDSAYDRGASEALADIQDLIQRHLGNA